MMSVDQMRRWFLLVMGLGLVPVALSYGAAPEKTLPSLYGLPDPDFATRHIFRAVMGLYLGMIVCWLVGAFRAELRLPALLSVFVFVTSIAFGRALSLVLDGWPQSILVFYMIAEGILAGICWRLLALDPDGRKSVDE